MNSPFEDLLEQSKLSRDQLAIAMGVHIKETYAWDKEPPTHVINYLGLYIEYSKLAVLGDAIKAIMRN